MNGTVDLCRWHYQIHRIQLKFILNVYMWKTERAMRAFICMVENWIHQKQSTPFTLYIGAWKLGSWSCDITVNIDCTMGEWYAIHRHTNRNQATNIYLFIYLRMRKCLRVCVSACLHWHKNNNAKIFNNINESNKNRFVCFCFGFSQPMSLFIQRATNKHRLLYIATWNRF